MSETSLPDSEGVQEAEMTFFEHLKELRGRILKALAGVVIGAVVCFLFINPIVEVILLTPAKVSHIKLQNLKPFGQVFLYFQVSLIGGVILSLPNLFYQFWKFISPALRRNERKYIVTIALYSTLSFFMGIVFAYYIMLPMTLSFAGQFGSPTIENQFAIDEYMEIIISVMLAAGVVFELPMVSFFLSKIGILTPEFMRKYRRHAIIVIMVLAAVLTPGTDPVSQLILAVPLVFLYEISIFVSKFSVKKA
ncbi:MAG: twin-arginine translocase subunit TatC [Ignavibacteriales bacterium]|nr:twin-arginine translocase subunit TatC [Ignavibacteriales bacterium]